MAEQVEVLDNRKQLIEIGDSIIILPNVMPAAPKEGRFQYYNDETDKVFFFNIETGKLNRAELRRVYKVPRR